MKKILLIAFMGMATLSYGQFLEMVNSPTWLYSFKKTSTHQSEWAVPYSPYGNNKIYHIYYAKDDLWQFVGTIFVNGSGIVYFKDKYRVAYGLKDEKPIEIKLETKQWKVE